MTYRGNFNLLLLLKYDHIYIDCVNKIVGSGYSARIIIWAKILQNLCEVSKANGIVQLHFWCLMKVNLA